MKNLFWYKQDKCLYHSFSPCWLEEDEDEVDEEDDDDEEEEEDDDVEVMMETALDTCFCQISSDIPSISAVI